MVSNNLQFNDLGCRKQSTLTIALYFRYFVIAVPMVSKYSRILMTSYLVNLLTIITPYYVDGCRCFELVSVQECWAREKGELRS